LKSLKKLRYTQKYFTYILYVLIYFRYFYLQKSVRKEVSISKVDANIKRLIAARYGMFQSIVGDDTNEIKLEKRTK
jgi:hypothetical protein